MWNKAIYSFHIGAWALWLAAAMLIALSTRNPFYLLLTAGTAIVVHRSINGPEGERREKLSPGETDAQTRNPQSLLLRVVVGVALAVAVLKGLSYHIGETVLFTLPSSLPVIGGPITAEGMAAAGLDSLSILTVLAVFTAFSAGADYYAMLRSVPPFMHQAALVTSIAITFVPQTVTRFGEIREAQALRGHRVRRVGDLVPLVMPLLAGGMERSMNLAEAMESRGFSRASGNARQISPVVVQSGLACGLGCVLVGSTLFAFAPDLPWLAWLVIIAGILLLGITLRTMGAGQKRSRYRRTVWREHDTPLAIVSAGVIGTLLAMKMIAPQLLAYDPFLRISMPPFDIMVAITILALLAPAAIVQVRRRRRPATGNRQPTTG